MEQMTCNVVVVGGGISGLYMAETLMRLKKENNVCLFEKDSRFGGRNYDVRFKQAPNISISKKCTIFCKETNFSVMKEIKFICSEYVVS